MGGIARGILALLAAVIVGFGVPLLWFWIGSKIQGVSGVTHMSKMTAIAMFPGIAISYAIVLSVVNTIRIRRNPELVAHGPRRERYPWMRSMRDEPERTAPPRGAESVFVIAASIMTAAFFVWFFFFAKSPI